MRSLSGSCELATPSRLREGQQPTGVTTDSVGVLIHASSGGDGDLSYEGMLLMGRGNIDVGEQMGGMTDTSRVGVRRGRNETEIAVRDNHVGSIAQNAMERIEHGKQHSQTEQGTSQNRDEVQQTGNFYLGQGEGE